LLWRMYPGVALEVMEAVGRQSLDHRLQHMRDAAIGRRLAPGRYWLRARSRRHLSNIRRAQRCAINQTPAIS
jgi:hypothetical protein